MADGKDESVNAGSSVDAGQGSGNGESKINLEDFVPKSQYAELERKLGSQGKELGEARAFITELTPLLDKLDANPEVVEALRDGKLDSDLAKAILEGRIGIVEAQAVAKANEDIKNDMGEAGHAQLSPEELAKQILEKIQPVIENVKVELKKDIDEVKDVREFEEEVAKFIASHPDYDDYADAITAYTEEHPEQQDLEMVYHYIKGRAQAAKAAADGEKASVEASKESLPPATGTTRNSPASEGPSVEDFVKLGPSANSFN